MVPTVLLVDDEEGVREALGRALEHAGYRVIRAVDGQAALDYLKREGDEIHVVVTDSRMPRLSGYQLVEWMAVWDYQQPTIFMSGYGQAAPTLPGPLLSKPFPAVVLIDEVRRSFRQAGISPPVLKPHFQTTPRAKRVQSE